MRARSASTRAADPYRAGLELGEALQELAPEVVFVFSTVHYAHTNELVEGLYDSLGREDLVVVGSTGDGYYSNEGVGYIGASALGLNSDGQVRWIVSATAGICDAPAATTRRALADMQARLAGEKPAFMYLLSDFRTDASELEKVIEFETDVPVIGGFAADDNQMSFCAVYCQRQALTNSLVLLAAVGPVHFEVVIGNALTAVGKPGVIEEAEGAFIQRIDGTDAMDFIERETGKPVLTSDRGVTSLTIIDSDAQDVKRLRSIVPQFSTSARALGLYGGISVGKTVQVCLAQPDEILKEVYNLAKGAQARLENPAAALIVSCVGRKWLLGERIDHEIRALLDQFGEALPLTGFPSFGEIGPLRTTQGYSRNLFHNMTYVLLLIGHA